MPNLATIEQPAALSVPKSARVPRISPKIKQAISLLSDGECKTQKAAAARVGVSGPYLSTQLNKPHIQAFIARKAAENINRGVLRASARLIELIDADSEHVAAKVAERIAEHGGVLKPQGGGTHVNVNVSNNIAAGYVIDLTPSSHIGRVRSSDAKPLIEHASASDIPGQYVTSEPALPAEGNADD